MVAHELNNVLMSILPFAEMLQRDPRDVKRVKQSAEIIKRAVRRGRVITGEVLALVRPVQLETRRIIVRNWIEEIEPELRALAGDRIQLEIRSIPQSLAITGDENALTQVI